ncbi:hypothetical protein BCR33DRAFT_801634 [Rhizoclosmatium globosum]|uniref:Chitin-binding type-4 domain-containing protein n=1 Tax=Rhizoclosmatium globosum TaxID=329046 RepID=A0A1Y2D3R2_9FUNG|nr:hypothetical protein BCR33DRAFT_801634 [Rhizoclosmatium globosum]|eukprot:ORY53857.1 hypothetical protein BCR33DRAFT_801634 [Rhizoclosmatium globosum]
MFTTKAILLVTLFKLVKAHGLMVWPSPRLEPGDAGNGYWIARSATKDACHGLSAGPVLTPALTGGSASIDYVVTVAHKGGCQVYLDRGNGWEQIGEDPTCGVSAHTGSIGITLPPGDYNAVIRWYWATDNASGEEFQTCADIKVSSQGTNLHSPPEQFGTNTCTQTGDMICYGNGYNECGAIDPATNKGYWVQKPCPGGHICNQIGLSDPLHKVLGLVECGYGSGAVQAQIPVPPVASSTNSPVIQPVTTSAIVSPTQISVPATASYESIITRVIASNTFSPQNQARQYLQTFWQKSQPSLNQRQHVLKLVSQDCIPPQRLTT